MRRQREALSEWLRIIVNDPLDRQTGDAVASVVQSFARPLPGAGPSLRARHLVAAIGLVQTRLIAPLGRAMPDRPEFDECVAAWCKCLYIHLDLLLALFSKTRQPPWY
jgi:hypothetical protein